jgi:uncharacterized coiled-coil protein SlyX
VDKPRCSWVRPGDGDKPLQRCELASGHGGRHSSCGISWGWDKEHTRARTGHGVTAQEKIAELEQRVAQLEQTLTGISKVMRTQAQGASEVRLLTSLWERIFGHKANEL